jgi:arabinan endo-1,5-alpha-L-arabinosidase
MMKLKNLFVAPLLAGVLLGAQAQTTPAQPPAGTQTPPAGAPNQPPRVQNMEPRKNISVHDPVMAKQGDTYYLFCTGRGISIWSSKDLETWKPEKPVFETAPDWAVQAIPNFRNHIWAPDISYHKGKYYLYYSVSAFGKNTSAIGVVTNTTLHPTDKDYKWVDHGKVIQSYPGKTNWNAIDPNIITDKSGTPWMSFGSFWDGLKLVKLNKDRLTIAEDPDNLPTIASRKKELSAVNPPSVGDNPVDAGGNAIEAPFIFKKDKYYYLFASIDYCCKGVNSTYKMIVARAKDVQGPYLDREGVSMAKGGGTMVLEGNKDWYGVGHNSVYTFDKKDYLVFHGYEAADNGRSKLRIETLTWDKDGWPIVTPKATTSRL